MTRRVVAVTPRRKAVLSANAAGVKLMREVPLYPFPTPGPASAGWIGLRDAEAEHYRALGENFEKSEEQYRTGFEAALRRDLRGKSFVKGMDYLKSGYPDMWQSPSFRHGFNRGQVYLRDYLLDVENRPKVPAAGPRKPS